MDRILIVDDAKATRDALSNIFSFIGFKVDVASNGNEGLNLFSKNSFDLVITDLQMPGMDGWTLAFHVKDKSPDTPVVLVTGEEKKNIMEKLKGSCVDSVLTSPIFAVEGDRLSYKVIGGNHVALPTHLYKIIVDTKSPDSLEALPFMLPNEKVTGRHYSEFLTTIDEIDRATGLDLLSALTEAVQDRIESH